MQIVLPAVCKLGQAEGSTAHSGVAVGMGIPWWASEKACVDHRWPTCSLAYFITQEGNRITRYWKCEDAYKPTC